MSYRLDGDVQYIKGVGPKRANMFAEEGIETVEDLLFYLPARYEDRSKLKKIISLKPRETVTVSGNIISTYLRKTKKKGFTIFEAVIKDDTASIKCLWMNQPYLQNILEKGKKVFLHGKVKRDKYNPSTIQIMNPDYEFAGSDKVHTKGIVPVYGTVGDIHPKRLRRIMKNAVENLSSDIDSFIPSPLEKKREFIGRREALVKVHFPEENTDVEKLNRGNSAAHRRLIYEEFLLLQTGLILKGRKNKEESSGIVFETSDKISSILKDLLPFSLTEAQRRTFAEVVEDMTSPFQMNRLIQGDVGSGKTIVALLSILLAVENGYQTAIMAPTEILAEQHFKKFRDLLKDKEYSIVMLKGSQPAGEKKKILEAVESGEADIAVGTHALIQEKVNFEKLGFVVVDEQHRFGVLQRGSIQEKGYNPDIIVMTATPIPRSLALTVYGELDLSVIDELPPGRKKIITKVAEEGKREKIYDFLEKKIKEGGRAYIVYPMIEESEDLDLNAAEEMSEHLNEAFEDFEVGLIHGQMGSEQRDETMNAFQKGEIQILVSTTVIEVGIDVPEANLMVVENAERFGLAQLHQLRGRIGRGEKKSYCILMTGDDISDKARRRMNIMEETSDGFRIAREDLNIRGPGDFFGTQQSGIPDFRIGNIVKDRDILEIARNDAGDYLDGIYKEDKRLLTKTKREWGKRFGLIEVG